MRRNVVSADAKALLLGFASRMQTSIVESPQAGNSVLHLARAITDGYLQAAGALYHRRHGDYPSTLAEQATARAEFDVEMEQLEALQRQPTSLPSPGLSELLKQGGGPGFLPDITPFNVTQFKTVGNGRGINPVLDQWDQETKTSLDSIYEEYRATKNKLEDLRNEDVIDFDTYTKRLAEAWSKFENASYISPVVITQRTKPLAQYMEDAVRQVHLFTSDFESSLQSAFDEGGSVEKNFVRNLIKALSDRALYRAIESIGDALAASLNKGATAGGFGGILGEILGSIFGGSGEISPGVVTQSKVPTYALGTDYVPHTGLAMLHQGESVNTAAETRGGRGVTFAPVYNIDARGATTDLVQALPEIFRRNNEALKADIIAGIQRKKYPTSR